MKETASSKDAILDAAEQLFARQGFASTTIKQIGADAGVNSALLYYYFDDKETLYREMLRRMIQSFAAQGARRLEGDAGPDVAVRRLIEFQVEFTLAHPQLPRLLVRELIDHEASHAEEQITHLAANLFERLCGVIRKGQKQGLFRAELNPKFAAISTIAQVAYMAIARPAVGILLGHGLAGPPPEVVRAFGGHAADFAIAALARSGPLSEPSTA
jgi:AcrR family transcriptional regulator